MFKRYNKSCILSVKLLIILSCY